MIEIKIENVSPMALVIIRCAWPLDTNKNYIEYCYKIITYKTSPNCCLEMLPKCR